ncbi:MAG: helix-turn-helix domain-containing protein [Gemmatimonadota bacterium]
MSELKAAEVFPPGEILKDELEERGWSQVEFAEIIGRDVSLVSDIIKGKRAITPTVAKEIGAAFGQNPMHWMNMDAAYRLEQASEPPARISGAAKVRARYPVRAMMNRGWIQKSESPEVVETNLLKFFNIASLDDLPTFKYAARKSSAPTNYEEITEVQRAWLFRVKQIAMTMVVRRAYSEDSLRNALPELKKLMGEPEEIRHVPRILDECGVRLVVVEPLPGSKVDGVCFWLDEISPVIGLSLTRDRIDNFWFNLRHEIEHVLARHAVFDSEIDPSDVSQEESQANREAGEFCVPSEVMDDFIARKRPIFSERNIIGLAARLGIHPGVVVGQLQRKIDRWNLLRKHQVRIREILTAAAMTDGYGHELQIG